VYGSGTVHCCRMSCYKKAVKGLHVCKYHLARIPASELPSWCVTERRRLDHYRHARRQAPILRVFVSVGLALHTVPRVLSWPFRTPQIAE